MMAREVFPRRRRGLITLSLSGPTADLPSRRSRDPEITEADIHLRRLERVAKPCTRV
jgi:hypothetical protein